MSQSSDPFERFEEADALLVTLLELPSKERLAHLQEACQGDQELETMVRGMLADVPVVPTAPDDEASSDSLPLSSSSPAVPPRDTLLEIGAHAGRVIERLVWDGENEQTSAGSLPGTRLGVYEIAERVGVGGMGEVYRARDTRLDRDVAVKVLPDGWKSHPERAARFEREARHLATLNHPNIAGIHHFGTESGSAFLVMELVSGETLSEVIARGPVPAERALRIMRQVAEALEAAHSQGIVHRDLKPANVKITRDDEIKVLDFGLAKAMEPSVAGLESLAPREGETESGRRVYPTASGVMLGTLPYMSPEQARGQEVDHRTDIWAFGCLLYELLTGQRAYSGPTSSDVLARILEHQPDWSLLDDGLDPRVRRLLRRTLRHDKHYRLQHIGDARVAIDEILGGAFEEPFPSEAPTARAGGALSNPMARWVAAAALLLAACGTTWWLSRTLATETADLRKPTRFKIESPVLAADSWSEIAVAPDGRSVIFRATGAADEAAAPLSIYRLGEGATGPVAGSEGGTQPFFSPDSGAIGFFHSATHTVRTVSLGGGAPREVAFATDFQGGTWTEDDTIVFSPHRSDGLFEVKSSGGEVARLTTVDPGHQELSHRHPWALPGGQAVLFTIATLDLETWDRARVDAVELSTGERRSVLPTGTSPQFASSGHLLFQQTESLMAVPLDLESLTAVGEPARVVPDIAEWRGKASYAVSATGTLVYVAGAAPPPPAALHWVDAEGNKQPFAFEPWWIESLRISRDRRLVLSRLDPTPDIWLHDTVRKTTPVLTRRGHNRTPIWTPGGDILLYSSSTGGAAQITRRPADMSRNPEILTEGEWDSWPGSASADGRTLAFVRLHPETGYDIWFLELAGSSGDRPAPRPFLTNPGLDAQPEFSPDGRYLAYTSAVSGRSEVYVAAAAGREPGVKVSNGGGSAPAWHGDALYFRRGQRMMMTLPTGDDSGRFDRPSELFEEALWESDPPATRTWDIAPDGRFLLPLVNRKEAAPSPPIRLVLDWWSELEEAVPHPNR